MRWATPLVLLVLGLVAAALATREPAPARLAILDGEPIVAFFSQYYKPAVLTLVGLAVAGAGVTLISYLGRKKGVNANSPPVPSRKTA